MSWYGLIKLLKKKQHQHAPHAVFARMSMMQLCISTPACTFVDGTHEWEVGVLKARTWQHTATARVYSRHSSTVHCTSMSACRPISTDTPCARVVLPAMRHTHLCVDSSVHLFTCPRCCSVTSCFAGIGVVEVGMLSEWLPVPVCLFSAVCVCAIRCTECVFMVGAVLFAMLLSLSF